MPSLLPWKESARLQERFRIRFTRARRWLGSPSRRVAVEDPQDALKVADGFAEEMKATVNASRGRASEREVDDDDDDDDTVQGGGSSANGSRSEGRYILSSSSQFPDLFPALSSVTKEAATPQELAMARLLQHYSRRDATSFGRQRAGSQADLSDAAAKATGSFTRESGTLRAARTARMFSEPTVAPISHPDASDSPSAPAFSPSPKRRSLPPLANAPRPRAKTQDSPAHAATSVGAERSTLVPGVPHFRPAGSSVGR